MHKAMSQKMFLIAVIRNLAAKFDAGISPRLIALGCATACGCAAF